MHYVKKNMGMRPMLYNDGMERFKLVKSGGTVEKIWRGLVGYADATILSKKRQEEPHNAHKWTLKFTDVKQGRLSGSVSQITDVSCLSMFQQVLCLCCAVDSDQPG